MTTEQFFDGMDIFKKYTLEDISCAFAHYCFRNGPIEDLHADGRALSQDDMKTLNKFCYDRIFTFLSLLKNNDIATLNGIMLMASGSQWDKPEFNIGSISLPRYRHNKKRGSRLRLPRLFAVTKRLRTPVKPILSYEENPDEVGYSRYGDDEESKLAIDVHNYSTCPQFCVSFGGGVPLSTLVEITRYQTPLYDRS